MNIPNYKTYFYYTPKDKEEFYSLYHYMIDICGFTPICKLNKEHYDKTLYVNIQGDNQVNIMDIPYYNPKHAQHFSEIICKSLNEFMEVLDHFNINWKKCEI